MKCYDKANFREIENLEEFEKAFFLNNLILT